MKKFALILAVVMIAIAPVSAQDAPSVTRSAERPDHLVPESSVLAGSESLWSQDYFNLITHVLSDGFDRDVEVRAVVLPSFSPEYLVGIRGAAPGKPTNYHVFYLRPKVQLWGYQSLQSLENGLTAIKSKGAGEKEIEAQAEEIARLKAYLPAKAEDTPLERCEKPMDAKLAERVKKVWVGVLRETHYPLHDDMGLDGVSFYFSAWDEYQPLSGQTWTPSETSKPGMLAELAETLVRFCDGRSPAESLERQADDLTKRLNP
jgi:hypothetical protein